MQVVDRVRLVGREGVVDRDLVEHLARARRLVGEGGLEALDVREHRHLVVQRVARGRAGVRGPVERAPVEDGGELVALVDRDVAHASLLPAPEVARSSTRAVARSIALLYSFTVKPNRDETLETLLVSVNRLIRSALQATGHTTSTAVWRTLGILETEEALRLGELATASRVSQPTMTRLVAGMTADGLIARTVDPDDSRGQLIQITDAGRERLVAWRAALTSTVGPLFEDLGDDDWDVLHHASALIAARARTETTA
ncbi:hypothetical protein DEI95_15890 [Curtobacterium sp. MCBD17_008]|nr:hypothetical protein DEI95_15890 [Curtobacterium sp. MCBD17_008]